MSKKDNSKTYNKGEWSELYAFIKLLKEGRIYAADENVCKMDNLYLPIIKLMREETKGKKRDYLVGRTIKIYENGIETKTLNAMELKKPVEIMYAKIFAGAKGKDSNGSFSIPEIEPIVNELFIDKVKASSLQKADIEMQIRDVHTGFCPEVGFSVKSDLGSPPTLLNSAKNTRIRCKITGLNRQEMVEINAIDKTVCKSYIVARFKKLVEICENIEYDGMKSNIYEDNLIMIDSFLPRIYGEMVLQHYTHIDKKIYNCQELIDIVATINPVGYSRKEMYSHKFKKMLCASALGMTPGKPWDGKDAATGGYIIIKKDGDVLCYHLYNRDFFEEYLFDNVRIDRPDPKKHDYGYIYEEGNEMYIDLNNQIRFQAIK